VVRRHAREHSRPARAADHEGAVDEIRDDEDALGLLEQIGEIGVGADVVNGDGRLVDDVLGAGRIRAADALRQRRTDQGKASSVKAK
jgi:hypothetical protein